MSTVSEVVAVIGEAEAIVEAEWMRLNGGDLPEDALADPFAEMPKPRPRPPLAVITTALQRRPGVAHSRHTTKWPARPYPCLRVAATQRSPPLRHASLRPFSSKIVVQQWR
jgi:hypothetical protein